MSVVMGKKRVMDLIQKNEILSTFGASPIACAAALASLDVLEEDKISERSERLGEVLRKTVKSLNPPHVKEMRGPALFQSLVLDCDVPGVTPRRVSALAMHRGVLVGIGADRLRFSPPLTISEEDVVKAVKIVIQALKDVTRMGNFPGSEFMN
jgi:ornithine--oxo-acid transaminase